MRFVVLSILDAIRDLGEDIVKKLISSFRCSMNGEIQYFLQNSAIDFAKKRISITYLVFNQKDDLVAYFTIAHKPIIIPSIGLNLSKTQLKRLERFSVFNLENVEYHASAFLIAQFGKDDELAKEDHIPGKLLMDYTLAKLRDIQYLVGGGIVFLECEESRKLLDFYEANGFKPYGRRNSSEAISYHQLLCVI